MNWRCWGFSAWLLLAVGSCSIRCDEAPKKDVATNTTKSESKAKPDDQAEQNVLYLRVFAPDYLNYEKQDDPRSKDHWRDKRPIDPTKGYMQHRVPKSQYEEMLEAHHRAQQHLAHQQFLSEQAGYVAKNGYSPQLSNFRAGPTKWGGWRSVAPIQIADYFAQTCRGYTPIEVFHQFRNYQHPGFVEYVQQLPGSEEFLLGLENELMAQQCSPLIHYIYDHTSSKEYPGVVTGMRNALAAAKAHIAQREVDRQEQVLKLHGFNQASLRYLNETGARKQLIYEYNPEQAQFMQDLGSHFNSLGEFYPTIPKDQAQVKKVTDASAIFGLAANEASRQLQPCSAEQLLGVAKNLLAFGRGALKSGIKFGHGLYQICRHPIDSACSAADCLANAGIGIAKVINSGARLAALSESLHFSDVNKDLVRQQINQEEQRWRRKKTQAYQIYQAVELAYQNASQEEVCEKTGEIITDLVLAAYGNKACFSALGKAKQLSGIAKYKPVALEALGSARKEIYQIVGLAAQYGTGKVKRGMELVRKYPALANSQATVAQSIKSSCDWVKALNKRYSNTVRNIFNGAVEREVVTAEAGTGMLVEAGPNVLLNEAQAGSKYTGSGFYANKAPINSYGKPYLETAPGWFLNVLENEKTVWMTTESGLLVPNYQLCDGICHTFLQKSVIGRNPHCLDHMIPQIKALEDNYLRGMSVQEFVGPKIAAMEEFKKRVEFGKNRLKPDYFHWLHPTPGIKVRDGELLAHRFSGFHLDYENRLEKMGEISSKILGVGAEGATTVAVKVSGIPGEVINTRFCSTWDLQKLTEKARQSYLMPDKVLFEGTDLVISSVTEKGLKMTTVISCKGAMKTLIPDLK